MLEVIPGECSKLNAEMETISRDLLITIINPSPHGKQTKEFAEGDEWFNPLFCSLGFVPSPLEGEGDESFNPLSDSCRTSPNASSLACL